jgi:hypothetical protein
MARMDLAGARTVLGVDVDAPWPEVRAAYRSLIRTHHPDGAGDVAEAGVRTLRTAEVTQAFALLLAARTAAAGGPSAASTHDDVPARWDAQAEPDRTGVHRDPVEDLELRSVLLDAEPMDAFLALHEAFSIVGVVSYIDRLSLVLETIVTPVPGQATSLLAWLDAGPDGTTRATLGVESLGGHAAADLDALVDRLAELLASPRPPVGSS